MNNFKLSLITLAILISGCGGGSSTSTTTNNNEAKTVVEAEKNLNAFSKFNSISLSSSTESSTTALKKAIHSKMGNQKTTTLACSNGGTLTGTISDDEKTLTYSFDKCQEGTSYIDGEMIITQFDNNNGEIKFNALTNKDVSGTQYMNLTLKLSLDSNSVETTSITGVVNQTLTSGEVNNISFTNFVVTEKDTSSESWSTIDGTINLESKCTTGTYTFETVEKLVDASDGTNNLESGILKLNGATYTFENPQVTITAGTESETILQTELEKRMAAHDTCDI